MKITMYELFGLIKDGKAPKKIRYRDIIWKYTSTVKGKGYQYYSKGYEEWKTLQNQVYLEECLNDEIEIIKEDKEFEDIREIRGEVERDKTLSHDENQDSIVKNFNMLIKWVNLLVRNQKRIINEINKLKGEK